jgi:hypothetical protein
MPKKKAITLRMQGVRLLGTLKRAVQRTLALTADAVVLAGPAAAESAGPVADVLVSSFGVLDEPGVVDLDADYTFDQLFGDIPDYFDESDWLDDVDPDHVAGIWSDLVSLKRARAPYTGTSDRTERRHRLEATAYAQHVWASAETGVRPPPPRGVLQRLPSLDASAGDAADNLIPEGVEDPPTVPSLVVAGPAPPALAATGYRKPSARPAPVAFTERVERDYDDDTDDLACASTDKECLERLEVSKLASISSNRKFDISTCHDHLRFLCVHHYFQHRCRGEQKIAASMKAATILRLEPTQHQGRRIREWAAEYAISGNLPELRQGKHAKTVSFIDDEDNANALRKLLRSIPRNLRTAAVFADKVNAAYPALEISTSTACRWMHSLGFHPYSLTSKTYVDGHERPDVVEYRTTFIELMSSYQKRMEGFDSTSGSILAPADPTLPHDVPVNHDEASFDSAAGRQNPWVEEGHAPMLPKRGQCLMVSAFISPLGVEHTRIIEPGSTGYWTNKHLIQQLHDWLSTVNSKYSPLMYRLIIQFDNSGNHGMYAPDALIATRLNLSDGWPKLTESDKAAWVKPAAFRNTTFTRGGVTHTQTFTFGEGEELQHKGICTILKERGMWRDQSDRIPTRWTRKDCSAAKVDHDAGVSGPQLCTSYCKQEKMLLEEALALLASQPDFVEQQKHNWITETVEHYGHVAVFGPKFHPELAPIELFWGDTKKHLKARCDYTLPTLKLHLPQALASVPPAHFRRYFAHVARYMRAYADSKLSLAQIEWAMRKYTSHRRAKDAPADLDAQFLGSTWFADLPESLKTEK